MQTGYKNKDMASVPEKKTKQVYFFAGGTEYLPMTIEAESAEEAQTMWEIARTPVTKNTNE